MADELERTVALHDASTIAAVIVEPMQGSTGVIVPPIGYLEKLREICSRHGILLIFDEVITDLGRVGTHFAAQRAGVSPDVITFAKAVTNGVVPLGVVVVRQELHEALMAGPEHAIELLHGYTYSGHPVACAAALASLEVIEAQNLVARAAELGRVLEDAVHSLQGELHVSDIRNFGLAAGVDLKPVPGKPGALALEVFEQGIDAGVLLRFTGDTLAFAPPFISSDEEVRHMIEIVRGVLRSVN